MAANVYHEDMEYKSLLLYETLIELKGFFIMSMREPR